MNILVVSATHFEVKPLLDFLGIVFPSIGMHHANIDLENKEIDVLITGVGMVNTAVMCGRHVTKDYDLVINAGVCGAFSKHIQLGDLVQITHDVISELGAEDGDDFLTFAQMDLPGEYDFRHQLSLSSQLLNNLPKLKAITVNRVHGNNQSIQKTMTLYKPDVESMEGAAFFAACSGLSQNYIQIRSVSNYVEKRDKSKWQMPLAIKNLNDFLIEFLRSDFG